MNNIMVDLETLGTKPGSVIVSIGAVKFGKGGLGEEFYGVVDLESCQKCGLTIDPGTVQWWMQQSDEARKVFSETNDSLFNVLSAFTRFIGTSNEAKRKAKVWGNGADFDNVLLAEAYKAVNLDAPWMFYNNRCYRTLKNLFPGVELERQGVYHNALDDAKTQAEHLVRILNKGK